jgi:D-arabinose 1-dehydrogenase-like Zn-dependent alcohol dehydrogenase
MPEATGQGTRPDRGAREGEARGGPEGRQALLFSQLNGIASTNETFPIEQAQAAYDRMMSGRARFRVVLKVDQ